MVWGSRFLTGLPHNHRGLMLRLIVTDGCAIPEKQPSREGVHGHGKSGVPSEVTVMARKNAIFDRFLSVLCYFC